jgi:hypothetical protein
MPLFVLFRGGPQGRTRNDKGNFESGSKDKLADRVARFADRREDWSVFGCETALDLRFARAQRRYLGASGSVDHGDLRGSSTATAATKS